LANRIYFPQQAVSPPLVSAKSNTAGKNESEKSFEQILDEKLNGELKFSRHAKERLKTRSIQLDESDLGRLQNAVSKARGKGARDSLILMDELALVVSVKNNTVVTVVDGQSLKENVFTNIDSAVII